MAVRDIFKVSWKTFVNPTAWFGYDQVRDQSLDMWAVLKNLFTIAKPRTKESFHEAMQRLKLSEDDVKDTAIIYRLYALILFIFGLLVFYYSFYILFKHWVWTGWLMGMAATGLCFAQAFKYDFWSLQMRRKTLGLTFRDWLVSLVGGKRKSS